MLSLENEKNQKLKKHKQNPSVVQIHEMVKDKGFDISYPSICIYVREKSILMILNCLSRSAVVFMVTSVRQAVYSFHIAACRQPYHFRERLQNCPGDMIYLILPDFAGL